MSHRNPDLDVPRLRALVRQEAGAMIATLQQLISYPSVNPPPEQGDVLSDETRAALAFMVGAARQLGMHAENLDQIVGYAEIGPAEAPETVGVLAHLDVVPAGAGWTHPPFAGEIDAGMIYGRGVEDDKGPAVSALYAMYALQQLDVALARRVRLILGTHEESGTWFCVDRYRESEGAPTMGFTPDALFPVICGEKGIVNVDIRAGDSVDAPEGRYTVVGWHAGTASNIVPASAWAAIASRGIGPTEARAEIGAALNRLAATGSTFGLQLHSRAEFLAQHADTPLPACDFVLATRGVEAHAATPWDGHNALGDLVGLLAGLPLTENAHARLAGFIARRIGMDWDGSGLGLAATDPKLGPTTVNAGLARSEGDAARVVLNIRPTPPWTVPTLLQHVEQEAGAAGFTSTISEIGMEPLFVDEADPLVLALLGTYAEITGRPAACTYIGGTTYAKAFPRTVAFGPLLPDEEMVAHQVDERVSVESIVRNAEIFAVALYHLTGE